MISEQDNSPEAVKGRVRSITKAIRYKARKEGGNMIKAFNDHMASAGSGIGAAERQMIKKSLGLTEKFSNWRSDLIEVMGEDDMEPKIKEKKIKNKIRINPEMSEEFKKIGGTVVEVLEVIDYDENYKPLEIETIDIIKPEPLKKKYVDEADMSGAPSIKDAKPAKKTKVKYDPHMKVMAPQIEKEEVGNVEEVYKGKHGQSDKEYAASRSQGGKMISGDDKRSGAEYTHGRRVKAANPGMQPDVGGKTKPKSQGKMDKGTRADLEYRKANLKKEETELDEYASMSPQEVMLQKKKAQLDVMIAKKRKQTISKAGLKSDEPTKTESVNEEESDAMKDKHLQRAGMGARANYKNPPKNVRSAAMSDAERQKSREASQRAFDFVKKSITDKYGKGAIMKTNKEENELDEKCWPGYRVNPKRKTKILFGKRYPNCEKAK